MSKKENVMRRQVAYDSKARQIGLRMRYSVVRKVCCQVTDRRWTTLESSQGFPNDLVLL